MRFFLQDAGIIPTICFKYDDMYFPFIVIWYTKHGSCMYDTFYHRSSAIKLYTHLCDMNKQCAYYEWDTNALRYIQHMTSEAI